MVDFGNLKSIILASLRTKHSSIIISFLFITTSFGTLAQSSGPATDSVGALFTKFTQSNTDKSIVLFTDRNTYMPGERIWFRANVVNANNGWIDLTFKNLFADLVNEKDSVIGQLVLDNVGLRTEGAFTLPGSIATGFYWIRCYTARQIGNDSSGIFLHPIYVLNSQLHDDNQYARQFERNLANSKLSNPLIHFYPERLSAIQGIISTGVIEIRNSYQNPLSVNGALVNSKDSIITSFTTNNLGLARLTFENDPAERYTAIFHWNGRADRYKLPAVDKTSIQLSVASQNVNSIKAFVTLEDSIADDTHTTIMAVKRDKLYFAAMGSGSYGITIPTGNFPGGIVRLLLFKDNKTLVSERQIYIPKQNVIPEINTDKKKYAGRENVQAHIKMTGPDGKPLKSALNVSVQSEWMQQFSDSIDANTIPRSDEFLLDAWISKYPAKYSADDIDLLLAAGKAISRQPADTGSNQVIQDFDSNKKLQNLIGKITDKKGNAKSDRIVSAIAKNTDAVFMDVDTTGKDGMFSVAIPQGFDSLQLSLQVTNHRQEPNLTDSINIDRFRYPIFSTPISSKQQFLANNSNTLALIRKYNTTATAAFEEKGMLKPVTVKAKLKKQLNYDPSRRLNSMSQIITSDKFRYGGVNALGWALLTVPGVTLAYGDISIFGADVDLSGHVTRPLLIVDGYAVPNNGGILEYLNSLNPSDIDFIEVLRGAEAAIYGVRGSAGVISINTRHGPDMTNLGPGNLRIVDLVTYHVCPKFEMPDYSIKETKNSAFPDLRTTIYWNGNIITNANGEADLSFYTADNAENYSITLTGLTENGELVYKRVTIGNTGIRK